MDAKQAIQQQVAKELHGAVTVIGMYYSGTFLKVHLAPLSPRFPFPELLPLFCTDWAPGGGWLTDWLEGMRKSRS